MRSGSSSSRRLVQDFASALEAGEGLGDLRADIDHLNNGATRKAIKAVNIIRSPKVKTPAAICRAPMYMTKAPTIPSNIVAERLSRAVPVKVFKTLSSKRCTPLEKTLGLAFLGVIALDDPDAGERFDKRPVTSDRICPRSRKIDAEP